MCPPPCSWATEMKRITASGNRSSASMYAEPTMPNTSVTPCATSVSTKASDGVMVCLPVTTARSPALAARFLLSVMVFMLPPRSRFGAGAPARDSCPAPAKNSMQHGLRLDVVVAERIGDRLAGHLAERHVQSVFKVRIVGERFFPALVGKREHERQRRVVEREGRSARHAARHVGD